MKKIWVVVGLALILLVQAPRVTSEPRQLSGGRVGAGYSLRLPGSGGMPPYRWHVVAGQLPPGVDLDEKTGTLTAGLLTTEGDYTFTVEFSDSGGSSSVRDELSIRVLPRQTKLEPIQIMTDSLPQAISGKPYKVFISTTGGIAPVRCAVEGKLPDGLTLIPEACSIQGTPPNAWTGKVRLTATDSQESPASVSRDYDMEIVRPPRSPFWLALLLTLGALLLFAIVRAYRNYQKKLRCWVKDCKGKPIRWVSPDTYVCPICGRHKVVIT